MPYKIFIVNPCLLRMAKDVTEREGKRERERERGWKKTRERGSSCQSWLLPPSQCQSLHKSWLQFEKEEYRALHSVSVFNTHRRPNREWHLKTDRKRGRKRTDSTVLFLQESIFILSFYTLQLVATHPLISLSLQLWVWSITGSQKKQ